MKKVRKAFIVQYIQDGAITTRIMIATDENKIYKKYPGIRASDVTVIKGTNKLRPYTVEII